MIPPIAAQCAQNAHTFALQAIKERANLGDIGLVRVVPHAEQIQHVAWLLQMIRSTLYRSWAQDPALNDLRGGASGIARPVACDRRPRQNSQDRALIQPGSLPSMASANT